MNLSLCDLTAPTTKLFVEALEDGTLPLAPGPEMQTTNPQPVIAAMVQQEVRAIQGEQSELNSFVMVVMQDIAQVRAYFVQEYAGLYKDINGLLNPPAGSGAAAAARHAIDQQPNIALQQTGSGAATTALEVTTPKTIGLRYKESVQLHIPMLRIIPLWNRFGVPTATLFSDEFTTYKPRTNDGAVNSTRQAAPANAKLLPSPRASPSSIRANCCKPCS